jgi:hypothetical protein
MIKISSKGLSTSISESKVEPGSGKLGHSDFDIIDQTCSEELLALDDILLSLTDVKNLCAF